MIDAFRKKTDYNLESFATPFVTDVSAIDDDTVTRVLVFLLSRKRQYDYPSINDSCNQACDHEFSSFRTMMLASDVKSAELVRYLM